MQDSTLVSMLIGRYGAAIWGIIALALSKWGITFTDAETSQIMAGASAVLSIVLIVVSKIREKKKVQVDNEPPSRLNNVGASPVYLLALLLAVGALCFILVGTYGCAGHKFPECNAKMDQSALLVKIANDHRLCLQDVGNSLIVANGVNISIARLYTAQQAMIAVDKWIAALKTPITAQAFKALALADIQAFPELILLTEAFTAGFDLPTVIDKPSVNILIGYLEEQVKPMLAARLKVANG